VQELSLEQFEAVKSWAVFALAVATAVTSALVAVVASLAERGTGPGKLNRTLRAWIARRRRAIYRDVPVPGPETIKEVEVIKEVTKEVPVDRIVEKEVVKEVPVDRIVQKEIIKEVPVDRIVEKEIIKEVPVDRVVVKEVPAPGPERIVEKVVVKWVPYDVASGLRIKPDGTLGELAQLRAAE
jgi:hypothetical protein